MTRTTVPLRITELRQLPLVAVMVDGRGPYEFILDTGASTLMVDRAVSEELGLATVQCGVAGLGAGGAIAPERTRLAELRVGDTEVRDVEAYVMDLGPIGGSVGTAVHGIIGYPFQSAYVVTIDYPRRELRLEPAPPERPH